MMDKREKKMEALPPAKAQRPAEAKIGHVTSPFFEEMANFIMQRGLAERAAST